MEHQGTLDVQDDGEFPKVTAGVGRQVAFADCGLDVVGAQMWVELLMPLTIHMGIALH